MDSHTAIERVGKSNIGGRRVEGCLGYRFQSEYLWHCSRDCHSNALQFILPRVTIYRVICERLEAVDRVSDAVECFLEMMSELGGEVYVSGPMTEWVSGEFVFCLFGYTHSTFLVRFHPPTSLRSRERW